MRWKAIRTLTRALVLASVLALALPWAVLADNLQDQLQSGSTYDPSIDEGETFTTQVLYYIDRTGGNNTTFPATVTFTAQDAPSWVALSASSLTFTGYGVENGQSLTISGTAPMGSGGNSYSFEIVPSSSAPRLNVNPAKEIMTITVREAQTVAPPTIEAHISGIEGNDGWYRSEVTVSWFVTGATSTVGCETTTIDTDTPGTTLTCTASNAGGETSESVTIKVDATPPTIGATYSPVPNSAGWNNTDVTITFHCDDAGSGIASCTGPVIVEGEGEGLTAIGTAVDNAGISASIITVVNIDKTLPTISGAPDREPNGNGWYNDDVTVTFTCEDALSGIAMCAEPVTLDQEGTGQSATGTARDNADNVASTTVTGINIDKTPPSTQHELDGRTGNDGWYTGPVTVELDATDNLSGVGATYYEINGTTFSYDGPFEISADGTHSVRYWSVDEADNAEEAQTVTIKIDTTPPTITFVSRTPANSHGWNNTDVVVEWSCSDDTSGPVRTTVTTTVSTEGANQSATGQCEDQAGNLSNHTVYNINIDKTAPTGITFIGGPEDGMAYDWGDTPAAPTCTADDELSGLASCEVTGYSIEVGTHTLTATATDKAGNSDTATLTYTVNPWTFKGFFKPVEMGGVYNSVKGGSTVPLKFQVFKGSTELTNPNVIKSITTVVVTCATGTPTNDVEEEATATGATELRYTGGQFMYNWKTPKRPNTCYQLTVTTLDGSTLQAYFKLK